jgi:arylsulfatase A-like enzyme
MAQIRDPQRRTGLASILPIDDGVGKLREKLATMGAAADTLIRCDGFQAIRGQRLAQQRELGIIPPDFRAAPHTPEVPIWEELPARRRKIEDQRMAAYAAMLDEIDQGIARMLAFLEHRGVLKGVR